jgi:hypothetical protein
VLVLITAAPRPDIELLIDVSEQQTSQAYRIVLGAAECVRRSQHAISVASKHIESSRRNLERSMQCLLRPETRIRLLATPDADGNVTAMLPARR